MNESFPGCRAATWKKLNEAKATSDDQIITIIKEADSALSTAEISREYGILTESGKKP